MQTHCVRGVELSDTRQERQKVPLLVSLPLLNPLPLTREGHEPIAGQFEHQVIASQATRLDRGDGLCTAAVHAVACAAGRLRIRRSDGDATATPNKPFGFDESDLELCRYVEAVQ